MKKKMIKVNTFQILKLLGFLQLFEVFLEIQ